MATRVINVESKRETTRALSIVLGYMCIGLLVTALSCLGFSFLFSNLLANAMNQGDAAVSKIQMILIITMISSFIALFILNLIFTATIFKGSKGAWMPYIIYAVVMGLALSPLVMFIDAKTIGTAFGITSGIFLILFLIGFFSKADLTPLGLIAVGLLCSIIFVPLPFLILYIISPSALALYSLIASAVCAVVIVLIVAFDANRMAREIQGGVFTNNVALYYAYTFYSDFIMIFIRVLYYLAKLNRK